MVTQALWLVSMSVVFGALSGTVSVITGLRGHSLGVFAVGLGVLADVTGSAVLIWRFRAEQHQPGQSGAQETRAAIIISVALAVVSIVLTVESVTALVAGSRPGTSESPWSPPSYRSPSSPRWLTPNGVWAGRWPAARCKAMGPSAGSERRPACWPSSPWRCITRWAGGGPTGSPHWPSRSPPPAWHTAPRHDSPG